MKTAGKVFSALTALSLLLAAASASAERRKVYFQHRADKTLRTDCVEIKGRNDALPRYTCYDDDGNSLPVTPGADWRLVKAEKVCFHHKVRDTIRICMEITPLEGNASSCYTCEVGDGSTKFFEPGAKWEKLAADYEDCAPRLQSFDVPRTMVIPTLPEWGADDAADK